MTGVSGERVACATENAGSLDRAEGPILADQPAAARRHAAVAARTVRIECEALRALAAALDGNPLAGAVEATVHLLVQAKGRVILTGMGKSGLVARKIAATLASTGTPSLFLHPGEASHGDLGMITSDDVVIALSWSGETTELSDLLHYCHRFAVPLIAMTAQPQSTLAQRSTIFLPLPQVSEACPNQLAPTSSTIVQASLGDALAIALIEARGFSARDFRIFHPRGRLGAQLRLVGDLMSTGEAVPTVRATATIRAATIEMSGKCFGTTAVVDEEDSLIGAFTDGDLRRSLSSASLDAAVGDHMTLRPFTVRSEDLASEALAIMNGNNISQLFVCTGGRLTGILHLHDILREEVL